MRGNGHTLSRLPLILALLAGTAILSGVPAPLAVGATVGSGNGQGFHPPGRATKGAAVAALARPDAGNAGWGDPASGAQGVAGARPIPSTATATRMVTGSIRPRLIDEGAVGAPPAVLPPQEEAALRRIVALQSRGDMRGAQRDTQVLGSSILLGSILAHRYLGPRYRASAAELSGWLDRFGDHADAPAIHKLLTRRLPTGQPAPPAPRPVSLDPAPASASDTDELGVAESRLPRNPALDLAVAERVARGQEGAALALIGRSRGLAPGYAARLRAEVAQLLFQRNDNAAALALAEQTRLDRPEAALAPYVGGLAAWRLQQPWQARALFARAAETTDATRLRAAAAFWAARASAVLDDPADALHWLRRAAAETRTLHGMLARHVLGWAGGEAGNASYNADDIDVVADPAPGLRALALLQIGQPERAAAELRQLWPRMKQDRDFARSVLRVAASAGLADLFARFTAAVHAEDGHVPAPSVPMPRLRPAGGFHVDPALVYALARVESNFDPAAVSPAGAHGLMQLMPSTAQMLLGNAPMDKARLHEPSVNLALGQRYLTYLARLDGVGNDLLQVLASYNAGPGSVIRWRETLRDGGDPLLFLELIPNPETRAFVPRVLLYSWAYAARLHRSPPGLDALAAGAFPRLAMLRPERVREALDNPWRLGAADTAAPASASANEGAAGRALHAAFAEGGPDALRAVAATRGGHLVRVHRGPSGQAGLPPHPALFRSLFTEGVQQEPVHPAPLPAAWHPTADGALLAAVAADRDTSAACRMTRPASPWPRIGAHWPR